MVDEVSENFAANLENQTDQLPFKSVVQMSRLPILVRTTLTQTITLDRLK